MFRQVFLNTKNINLALRENKKRTCGGEQSVYFGVRGDDAALMIA
jgi:hypothetical protein